jgi:signal transduction histidine kinase
MARSLPLPFCDAPRTAGGQPPWYRRVSAGLEGKLVLCFMVLLTAALGASLWMFVSETTTAMDAMADEQAAEVSRTLAMASRLPLQQENSGELDRLGTDLMQTKGIMSVAFFSTGGNLLSVACREQNLKPADLGEWANSGMLANPRPAADWPAADWLARPRHRNSPALGSYVELTTAVTASRGRVVGFVTVCLAQGGNESRMRNIALTVLLIGAVAAGVSFPLMYWLVHRVFQPIRQLVAATERIARGDLETRVALNRSDVIGTLARSFNEMVNRVRSQQEDLGRANRKLAEANSCLADANQKLSGSNRDLEEKVQQRTTQVEATSRQLEAANRRLSSEIAEKEDFLRTVSHDLNAPLRNIAGMAATLLMKYRSTFDEEVVRRLERICRNVEVETDLIAELLELSRIKTRRHKMETVDLNELLGELTDLFEQDLESRRIRLTVDGPLPELHCERARLRQVFQNLIDNAIKYMGEPAEGAASVGQPQSPACSEPACGEPACGDLARGEPAEPAESACGDPAGPAGGERAESAKAREISIGYSARGGEAEFYVRDTGVGIAPEDLEKIFHVFRRGSGEAVQLVAGKGVGLASVKSIIETYNGTIWVESQVGIGSTFRFTINGKHLGDAPAEGTPPSIGPVRQAHDGPVAQYTCPAA